MKNEDDFPRRLAALWGYSMKDEDDSSRRLADTLRRSKPYFGPCQFLATMLINAALVALLVWLFL